MQRLTLIAPAHDVDQYLDAFFQSIVDQSIPFRDLARLIVVDDGSTDTSRDVCARWQAAYPDAITILHQEHAGMSAARNLALDAATTDWVTFVDADDFLDPGFLDAVQQEIMRADVWDSPLRLIIPKTQRFFDADQASRDDHPLRTRYGARHGQIRVDKIGRAIHAEVAGVTFHRATIERQKLRFDSRLDGAGEDGQFVNAFLLGLRGEDLLSYVPEAIYQHRQRVLAEGSAADVFANPRRYDAMLPIGIIPLLERTGKPPLWLQCWALYEILAHLRYFVNRVDRMGVLSAEGCRSFVADIRRCVALVDLNTVTSVHIPGFSQFYRAGLLKLTGRGFMPLQKVFLDSFDAAKSLVRARYYTADAIVVERFSLDDRLLTPLYPTVRQHRFFDEPFAYERITWLPVGTGGQLVAEVGNRPVRLSIGGRLSPGNSARVDEIVAALHERATAVPEAGEEHEALRAFATSPEMVERFSGCWLLCDRDIIADDNAEHLYRYLRSSRPDIKAYFALRRDSVDWPRLEAEGFELVDYGSMAYNAAVINAAYLVSSHTLGYMLKTLDIGYYADLVRHKVVFLQHGVIKDDLSSGLSRQAMDMFVTSTFPEYASIAEDGTYRFSDKETALTGLPRHDRLIERRGEAEKMILVMPTWRGELAGALTGNGSEREFNPDFHQSEYAMAWRGFLASEELRRLTEATGYRVVFCPHPNVVPYLPGFDLPPYIEMASQQEGSLQDQFTRAALMITDYSSVFFEMAVLRRPVIYYQFDEEKFFKGGHTYAKGYFDYRTDGFGPVVTDFATLIESLAAILANDGAPEPKYLERMDTTFAFQDGRNCERVTRAILALNEPEIAPDSLARSRVAHARRLVGAEQWADADEAWQVLVDDPVHRREALLALAEAAVGRHDRDAATTMLEAVVGEFGVAAETTLLQARLGEDAGDLDEALRLYRSLRRPATPASVDTAAALGIARVTRLQKRRIAAKKAVSEIGDGASIAVRQERAAVAMETNDWAEALALLEEVREQLPPRGMLMLAECLRRAERLDEAREALGHLSGAEWDMARAVEEARLATARQDWPRATELWGGLVDRDGAPAEARLMLARARRMHGDLSAAAELLADAAEGDLGNAYYLERALLLTKLAQWQEAADAWREVLRRSGGKVRVQHLALAEVLLNLGDTENAIAHVEKFRSTGPDTQRSSALLNRVKSAQRAR